MTYGSFSFTQQFILDLIEIFQPKVLDGVPRYGKIRTTDVYEKIRHYFPEDVNQIQITRMLRKWLNLDTVRYPEGYYLKTSSVALTILWNLKGQFKPTSILQLTNKDAIVVELPKDLFENLYGKPAEIKPKTITPNTTAKLQNKSPESL